MRFLASFSTLVVLLLVGFAGILGAAARALFTRNKKLDTPFDARSA